MKYDQFDAVSADGQTAFNLAASHRLFRHRSSVALADRMLLLMNNLQTQLVQPVTAALKEIKNAIKSDPLVTTVPVDRPQ